MRTLLIAALGFAGMISVMAAPSPGDHVQRYSRWATTDTVPLKKDSSRKSIDTTSDSLVRNPSKIINTPETTNPPGE